MVETRRRLTVTTFYAVTTPGSGNFIPSTTAQDLGSISLHISKLSNTKDKKLNKILTKHATIWMYIVPSSRTITTARTFWENKDAQGTMGSSAHWLLWTIINSGRLALRHRQIFEISGRLNCQINENFFRKSKAR